MIATAGCKTACGDAEGGALAPEDAAGSWEAIDKAIISLAKRRGQHDLEEGRWLLAARAEAVHLRLGMASLAEYVEHRLGHRPRTTFERLRVAEALIELRAMGASLGAGVLTWSAVRELTRVAVPETEARWLAAAHGKTPRELERMVAGRRRGDGPDAPRDPDLVNRVLRLEVAPEVFARYREAVERVRRDVDERLTEEQALDAMLHQVLGGPTNEGRAPYQVALTVCEACGRAWQKGRDLDVEVDAVVVEQACCDGQHIGRVDADDSRAVAAADRTVAEGTDEAGRGAHVGASPGGAVVGAVAGARGGDPADAVDAEADRGAHVGAGAAAWVGPRARQSIPPATRRAVIRRDRGRCRVPSCRNTRWLDVHHLAPRSAGGANDQSNLLCLCGVHHRLQHRGWLIIEGTSAADVRFRHADGTTYGVATDATEVAASQAAYTGLLSLGVPEAAARGSVAAARSALGARGSAEALVDWAVAHRAAGPAAPSRDSEVEGALRALGFPGARRRQLVAAARAELGPDAPAEALVERAIRSAYGGASSVREGSASVYRAGPSSRRSWGRPGRGRAARPRDRIPRGQAI